MRQFRTATSAVVRSAAVLAALAVVACGGGNGASAPAAAAREQQPLPEEPRVSTLPNVGAYGGRFIVGQLSGPKTFNHMMSNETSSSDITLRMFMSLADFDNETQKIIPGVAKSWSLADDKLTWTFNLRKGAKFSDGQPITAADVLFSFEVAYDETLHPSVQDLLIMNGKRFEISAPDEYTVVFKTPQPNAMLVEMVGSVYIFPKHVLESSYKAGNFASAYSVSTPPDQLVVSGPWRLKEYVAGEKVVLAPNPYWFGVDQAGNRLPYLDEVVYLTVPDLDAADLKFRAGELDGLDSVKPENYTWYEQNQAQGNFTLHDLGPDLSSTFVNFNQGRVRKATAGKAIGEPHVGAVKYAWFTRPEFRRAVSMAIDRDSLIPSVYFGNAVKNWSTSTPGNKLWYYPNITKWDYNPTESKRLLARLGWKDGNGDGVLEDTAGNPIAFTLKTNSSNNIRVAMGNFIRDDLAKVGIKMTLAPVDFNTLITNLQDDFQFEAVLLGLGSGIPPDPSLGQNVYRSSGRTHQWNPAQPKPETPEEARIDALMDVIVAEPSYETRKKAWEEVQNIVNDQSWMIWLPTQVAKLPLSNRFGNTKPSLISHRLVWNIDQVYDKARVN